MKTKIKVFYNAQVHTMDPVNPRAASIAVQGSRIIAVGSSEQICSMFAGSAEMEDLDQRVILPGLTDSHIHLQNYSLALKKIDCETGTREECLERVSRQAAVETADSWILGHGWNQNTWPEGFGTAQELDRVTQNHPAYLTAKSLHAAWVNTKALRLARITRDTPDPIHGEITRDEAGNPTGILFESAMELVNIVIPQPTDQDVERAISKAIPGLWQVGLTGIHDFDRRQCFSTLQSIHQRGELGLRVMKSIPLEDLEHALGLGLHTGFGDDFLWVGPVKAFADGALGPHTASMLKPYEDDPDNLGILMLDAEQIYDFGIKAVDQGLSLAVHAIGDRANHEVLNALAQLGEYETSLNRTGRRLRHRIEHVQVLHPEDIQRLASLNVIASMQPIHATSDMLMADRFWGQRAALSYAWKSLQDQGTRLAFGSDAPVESVNPFWGIHAAVSRQRQDGSPDPLGWYPSQRLTLQQALKSYTSEPAYAAGIEDKLGKLSPGYLADMVLLNPDFFTLPFEEIHQVKPEATMINGQWVWRNF